MIENTPINRLARSFEAVPNSNEHLLPVHDKFLEKVKATILRNISKKEFTVEALARQMFLSVSQLNRRLNRLLGRPAGQLIRESRLHFAARLLSNNHKSIGEIAQRSGFSDQSHFCRTFKKCFRCTPSQYRKQHQHQTINLAAFFS